MHVIAICTASVDDDSQTTAWVNMNLGSTEGVASSLGGCLNSTCAPTQNRLLNRSFYAQLRRKKCDSDAHLCCLSG